eukprot:212930-Amphidinium_carterae.3
MARFRPLRSQWHFAAFRTIEACLQSLAVQLLHMCAQSSCSRPSRETRTWVVQNLGTSTHGASMRHTSVSGECHHNHGHPVCNLESRWPVEARDSWWLRLV